VASKPLDIGSFCRGCRSPALDSCQRFRSPIPSEIEGTTIERKYKKMKRHILVRTVIIALLGSAATNAQTPTETPSATQSPTPKAVNGACNHSSWNPELYTFYGAKDTTVAKLDKVPADLSERRVWVQVTQGDKKAEVKLFEREGKGSVTVTVWIRQRTPSLLADIDQAIMDNHGKECIGAVVKSYLVERLGNGKTSHIDDPQSPKDAFSPSVDAAQGDFVETTIILLC
jgi:hypothetical protein